MMKRFLAILFVVAWCSPAYSQTLVNGAKTFPVTNDTTTGTTANYLALINPAGNAILATNESTATPVYVVGGSAGKTGAAALGFGGILPCNMDSTLGSGAGGAWVVANTSTGQCHPQVSAPASGTWIVGFLATSSTTSGSTALVQLEGFLVGSGGSSGSGACGPSTIIVGSGYICAGPPILSPLAPPILDEAFGYSPASTSMNTSRALAPMTGNQLIAAVVCNVYPASGAPCITSASQITDTLGDTYTLIGPTGSSGYMSVNFAITTVAASGNATVTVSGLSASNTYGLGVFQTYNIGAYDISGHGGGGYQSTSGTANITTGVNGDLLIGIGFNASGLAFGPLQLFQSSSNWAILGNSGQINGGSQSVAWGWSGTYQSTAGANSLTWSSTTVNGLFSGQDVIIFAFSPTGAYATTGPPTFRNLYATDIPSILSLSALDLLPTYFYRLPACTTGIAGSQGMPAFVLDSTTNVQGATVSGGGSNPVFAGCNGTNWVVVSGTGSGSGTVTSVGLTLPSFLAVTGSPVTASGTLAGAYATGLTSNEGQLVGVNGSGAAGLNPPSTYNIPVTSGAITATHCASWSSGSPPTLQDAGAACGTGGTLVTLQTNGTNNASQVLLNAITSTANSVGLTITPSNPSGGQWKFEITGGSYTGNSATSTLATNALGLTFGSTNLPTSSSVPTSGTCLGYNGTVILGVSCGGSGSGFTGMTSYGVAYATSGTGGTSTTPPATIGSFALETINTSSSATAPQHRQIGLTAREVTGSSDTIVASDCAAGLVNYKTAATISVALGTPSSLNNTGCAFSVGSTFDGTNTPPTVTFTAGGSYHFSVNGGSLGSTFTLASTRYAFIYPDQTETAQWDVDYPVVNGTRACVIDNDTQSSTPLVAANFSGRCNIPKASTIVEVDVLGGTGVVTGTATAPTVTGTSSVQIGIYRPSGSSPTTGILSAVLATASGKACALPTAGSATCGIMGITQAGSSLSISTTSLNAGDVLYVSAATPDAAQTWYTVTIYYQ